MNLFLADMVVLLHFSFIVLVIFGGIVAMKWRWIVWLHIPAAIWGSLVILFGWICPLTPLENMLRHTSGNETYSSSFITHYIMPVIYPPGLTRDVQIAIGIVVTLLNLIVYIFVYRRWRRGIN